MSIDLICGFCDSSFSINMAKESEGLLLPLVTRFCNSHSFCGYVTPAGQDDSDALTGTAHIPVRNQVSKRKIRRSLLSPEEEVEEEEEDE